MTAAVRSGGALPGVVAQVEGGQAGRVTATADLAAAVAGAWLVVEAVPERLDLKRSVFARLDTLAPPDAVLATSSSSYPSSRLRDVVRRPERLVNTHFSMPPERTAVEVTSSGSTDPEVVALLVRRGSVGFIDNRIWAAIEREALAVVEEGVAALQEVDGLFDLDLGHVAWSVPADGRGRARRGARHRGARRRRAAGTAGGAAPSAPGQARCGAARGPERRRLLRLDRRGGT